MFSDFLRWMLRGIETLMLYACLLTYIEHIVRLLDFVCSDIMSCEFSAYIFRYIFAMSSHDTFIVTKALAF